MARLPRNTHKLNVWISPEVLEYIRRKAEELGISLSEYFRGLALEEMKRDARQ